MSSLWALSSRITGFYLHLCEADDDLGLGSELSTPDPLFRWASSLHTAGVQALLFSTRRVTL